MLLYVVIIAIISRQWASCLVHRVNVVVL